MAEREAMETTTNSVERATLDVDTIVDDLRDAFLVPPNEAVAQTQLARILAARPRELAQTNHSR